MQARSIMTFEANIAPTSRLLINSHYAHDMKQRVATNAAHIWRLSQHPQLPDWYISEIGNIF